MHMLEKQDDFNPLDFIFIKFNYLHVLMNYLFKTYNWSNLNFQTKSYMLSKIFRKIIKLVLF